MASYTPSQIRQQHQEVLDALRTIPNPNVSDLRRIRVFELALVKVPCSDTLFWQHEPRMRLTADMWDALQARGI